MCDSLDVVLMWMQKLWRAASSSKYMWLILVSRLPLCSVKLIVWALSIAKLADFLIHNHTQKTLGILQPTSSKTLFIINTTIIITFFRSYHCKQHLCGLKQSTSQPTTYTMKVNCAQLMGIIQLVLANLALLISILTPFWTDGFFGNRGLFAACFDSCTWYHENDFFLQKNLPGKFPKLIEKAFVN